MCKYKFKTWHSNLKYDHSPTDKEIIDDFHKYYWMYGFVFHEFQYKRITRYDLGYDGIVFNAQVEIIYISKGLENDTN